MDEKHTSDIEYLKQIVAPLITWYHKNKRTLPWRESPTPYRVWVSEIMLQQTRVEAGKGYFERFVRELPDVKALANVEDELLMKLWEGLGYYNRARNLKKAAGAVMEKYGGELPAAYEQLLELPGVGPYTAGAVASIAFGVAAPAVDGNVLRVISRILMRYDDIALGSVKKEMEKELLAVMPRERPGDFNQALMELGAIVCLPNGAPKCGECPVETFCKAKAAGAEGELPVKKSKKDRRVEKKTVLILIDDKGRMALRRRPSKGLLSGLWELPSFEGELSEAEVLARLAEKGIRCRSVERVPDAKHVFSHIEWHMRGYAAHITGEEDGPGEEICETGRTSRAAAEGYGQDEEARGTDFTAAGAAVAEERAVYLKDVEEKKKVERQRQEEAPDFEREALVFAGAGELADLYALPSAFKGFSKYFPGN